MKSTKKPLSIEAPQSLIQKLKSYSDEHLTDSERASLNTVFGVFNYTMKHRETAFKEQPEFLEVITKAVANTENSLNKSTKKVSTEAS